MKVDRRTSSFPQAKFPTQLNRLFNSLNNYLPVQDEIEPCQLYLQPLWHINLPTLHPRLHISISYEDKTTTARQYTCLFNSINNSDDLILYTDSSELQRGGVGAGVVMIHGGRIVDRWSVGLGMGIKVYDGELAGIARALTEASRTSLSFKHIWIFTDNQAAIRNSFKLSPHPGQQISLQIQQLTKHLLNCDLDRQLHLHWVPGHIGIQGNDEADTLAKQPAVYPHPTHDSYLSLTKLKTQIRKSTLLAWYQYSTQLPDSRMGRHFRFIHFHLPRLTPPSHFYHLAKHQLATVTQLRLGHGYFKSYLCRVDENISNTCTCDRQTPAPDTPEHIRLYCNKYQPYRKHLRQVAQYFHLLDGLGTKAGLMAVGKFVEKGWARTRKDWLGAVKRDEYSGNGRRGEKEEQDWEQGEEGRVEEWGYNPLLAG